MNKNVEKIQTFLMLGVCFLMPLVFNPWGLEPYESWKNSFFYIGTGLSLLVLGCNYLQEKRGDRSIPRAIILGSSWLFLILIVGMMVSDRPVISFFGAYPRRGGTLNWVAYIGLFWIGWELFKQQSARVKFINTAIATGVIISIYAVIQKMGWDFLDESVLNFYEGRAFSTLGNPNTLGEWLIFPTLLAIQKLVENPKSKNWSVTEILALGIWASGNRASMLALAMLYGMSLLRGKISWRKILTGICIVLAGIGIISQMRGLRSIESRIELWKISTQLIEEKPILGYGMENFSYEFEKKITRSFLKNEDYLSIADRPHNLILENWINFGILGAITTLAVLWLTTKIFIKTPKNDPTLFWIGALWASLISQQFSFFLCTQAVYSTLFLSVVISQKQNLKQMSISKGKWQLLGVLWITIGFGLSGWGMYSIHLDSKLSKINWSAVSGNFYEFNNTLAESEHLYIPYPEIQGWISRMYMLNDEPKKGLIKNKIQRKMSHDNIVSLIMSAELNEQTGKSKVAEEKMKQLHENGQKMPILFQTWAKLAHENGEKKVTKWAKQKLLKWIGPSWRKSRIFQKTHPTFKEFLKRLKK